MSWISINLSRLFSCLAMLLLAALPASAVAANLHIEDTFTRPDGADLGVTEVGSYPYFISGVATVPPSGLAQVLNGELVVYGNAEISGNGVGMVLVDADLADVTMSADMRFQGLSKSTNTSTYNVGGFILRRNDMSQGYGANNEGQIEVTMFPGGGLFIREVQNGILNTLYGSTDPNPFGLGGSNNNVYSQSGQLPVNFNGLPFDANGNGVLENGESFRFGVSLVGNALDVLVNDLSILSLQVTHDEPVMPRSVSGFYKNRYTSSQTRDAFNVGLDNLTISGEAVIPEPSSIVLLIISMGIGRTLSRTTRGGYQA